MAEMKAFPCAMRAWWRGTEQNNQMMCAFFFRIVRCFGRKVLTTIRGSCNYDGLHKTITLLERRLRLCGILLLFRLFLLVIIWLSCKLTTHRDRFCKEGQRKQRRYRRSKICRLGFGIICWVEGLQIAVMCFKHSCRSATVWNGMRRSKMADWRYGCRRSCLSTGTGWRVWSDIFRGLWGFPICVSSFYHTHVVLY